MNREADILKDRLVSEFGYPQAGADLVAGKLVAMQGDVWDAFVAWWESGKNPEIEIEGYSFDRLVRDYSMKPIAALLTLDWLQREPEKAVASLRKGHDFVKRK